MSSEKRPNPKRGLCSKNLYNRGERIWEKSEILFHFSGSSQKSILKKANRINFL